jgi:hypothetical protein
MIRLYRKDNNDFKDFPDYIFSEDTTIVTSESTIINSIEYYNPSVYNDLAEIIQKWGDTPDNRVDYEYYNNIEETNPSGAENIKYIKYIDNMNQVKYYQMFIWNIKNKIVSHSIKKGEIIIS